MLNIGKMQNIKRHLNVSRYCIDMLMLPISNYRKLVNQQMARMGLALAQSLFSEYVKQIHTELEERTVLACAGDNSDDDEETDKLFKFKAESDNDCHMIEQDIVQLKNTLDRVDTDKASAFDDNSMTYFPLNYLAAHREYVIILDEIEHQQDNCT